MSKAESSTLQESAVVQENSLLDQIMSKSRITPAEEGYETAKKGVAAFISKMLESGNREEPINKILVDQMIAELDKKISAQMDEILHHEKLQQVESAWRGIKLLVDRTDFRENIKIQLMHATDRKSVV